MEGYGGVCVPLFPGLWRYKVVVFGLWPLRATVAEQLFPSPSTPPVALSPAKCVRTSSEMTKRSLVNCTTDCLELKVLIYMTIALTAQ